VVNLSGQTAQVGGTAQAVRNVGGVIGTAFTDSLAGDGRSNLLVGGDGW